MQHNNSTVTELLRRRSSRFPSSTSDFVIHSSMKPSAVLIQDCACLLVIAIGWLLLFRLVPPYDPAHRSSWVSSRDRPIYHCEAAAYPLPCRYTSWLSSPVSRHSACSDSPTHIR